MKLNNHLGSLQVYVTKAYVVLAFLLLPAFLLITPPFFGADEIAHGERAMEIAHGEWVAVRANPGSVIAELPDVPSLGDSLPTRLVTKANPAYGAPIDTGYLRAAMLSTFVERVFLGRYPAWMHRPNGRFPLAKLDSIKPLRWSGKSMYVNFQNTAVYPPPLYLPAALGWRIGEHCRFTIVSTLYLARACNAVTALLLGWLALRLAGPDRLLFAAILLLPALLTVEASCSQDAILVPIAVLMASILSRSLREKRYFRLWELAIVIASLALCIAARPPYVWLITVLLLPALDRSRFQSRDFRLAIVSAALALLPVAGWRYLIRDSVLSHSAIADPPAQLAYIKSHVLHSAWTLAAGTLANVPQLLFHAVEVLELRSVLLTAVIFGVHILAFVLIFLLADRTSLARLRTSLVLGLSLFLVLATISFAEYLIWNAPGASTVDGIQARYLLALLPFCALLISMSHLLLKNVAERYQHISRPALILACVAFLVGILANPFFLAFRYFGTDFGAALHKLVA